MKIIILAGGKGTRLWPFSRKTFPKQFLPIREKTLFQQTLQRCLLVEKPENIFISTNQNYDFYVEQEIEKTGIKKKNIIIEPCPKSTAPAILFALNKIKLKKDELVFVCPADHHIYPENKFVQDIEKAKKIANLGYIVTLGIKPLSPETGYGYIKVKKNIKSDYYKVEKFLEKPCLKKAKEFFQEKNYYWNSGMFLFSGELIKQEFEKHAPDLVKNLGDFEKIKLISFDKAVIEKSNKVVTLPVSFFWNDIGSWDSFYQIQQKDKKGNVIIGNTLTKQVNDSLILGSNRLIACFGIKKMTVIETGDAVFVAPKNKSQEVKTLVQELEKNHQKEAYEGLKINRPWGSYTVLEEGNTYKIKKIIVNAKKRLSLQSHKMRSEHWVVIKGRAKVILNDKEFFLKKGESTFVSKKSKHRLANPSKESLEIIEVQNGSYLEEDDIVRYEDDFKR